MISVGSLEIWLYPIMFRFGWFRVRFFPIQILSCSGSLKLCVVPIRVRFCEIREAFGVWSFRCSRNARYTGYRDTGKALPSWWRCHAVFDCRGHLLEILVEFGVYHEIWYWMYHLKTQTRFKANPSRPSTQSRPVDPGSRTQIRFRVDPHRPRVPESSLV